MRLNLVEHFLPRHATTGPLSPLIGRHAEPPFPSLRPNSLSPPLRRRPSPEPFAIHFVLLALFIVHFFFSFSLFPGTCFPLLLASWQTGKSTFAFGHAQLYARRGGVG